MSSKCSREENIAVEIDTLPKVSHTKFTLTDETHPNKNNPRIGRNLNLSCHSQEESFTPNNLSSDSCASSTNSDIAISLLPTPSISNGVKMTMSRSVSMERERSQCHSNYQNIMDRDNDSHLELSYGRFIGTLQPSSLPFILDARRLSEKETIVDKQDVCGNLKQEFPIINETKESSNLEEIINDRQALQIALNLSLMRMDTMSSGISSKHLNEDSVVPMCNKVGINPSSEKSCIFKTISSSIVGHTSTGVAPLIVEDRSRKSQNMTECVPVPSSEHVAEIVGRQGCKIKALRAKTNTYIKTPVRGEEPVFVVTGRKEDVSKAKKEILSAADHFSLIRASRKISLDDSINKSFGNNGNNNQVSQLLPGQITIQVRVPYRVVGLVVGPKGSTIKHIQQDTHTYIVTPSREKEPIFEVTGIPENVEAARHQIEAHIALRTGFVYNNDQNIQKESDYPNIGDSNSSVQSKENDTHTNLVKLYKFEDTTRLAYNNHHNKQNKLSPVLFNFNEPAQDFPRTAKDLALNKNNEGVFKVSEGNDDTHQKKFYGEERICENIRKKSEKDPACNMQKEKLPKIYTPFNNLNSYINSKGNISSISNVSKKSFNNSYSSASSTASSKSTYKNLDRNNFCTAENNIKYDLVNMWQNLRNSVDEGIEESANNWTLISNGSTINEVEVSPTESTSPVDSVLEDLNFSNISTAKTNFSQSLKDIPSSKAFRNKSNNFSESETQYGNVVQQECLVCNRQSISAALVPCGHNLFCIECANRICSSLNASCPICSLTVYHAIRILV